MIYQQANDSAWVPETVKKLWNEWDIRLFVISSLFLQVLLIVLAPIRKRKLSRWLSPFIWSFYLLADWIAAFSLGLLSDSQNNDNSDCASIAHKIMRSVRNSPPNNTNKELQAFWAPFLLLHLGGPDTITAFALEDNELWLRHLLGLLFEVSMAGYVFSRAFPMKRLLPPTLLMFFVGTVKYAERTRALYLASMDGFRDSMLGKPDPGPNYAKLMNELTSKKEAGVPAEIVIKKEELDTSITVVEDTADTTTTSPPLNNIQVIEAAHHFFETFRGLIANLIFSFRDRDKSQTFFKKLKAEDAFRVVEAELNFIYEVLYTKGAMLHTPAAYVLRGVCSCSILASLVLFVFTKKPNYDPVDVGITYALLGGAAALDIVALIMFLVSDKMIISIFTCCRKRYEKYTQPTSILSKVLNTILSLKNPRWSESMSRYNLIDYCLVRRPACVNWTVSAIGVRDYLDHFLYTYPITIHKNLKKIVFSELMKKSKRANDSKSIKMMCAYRGSWALAERGLTNLIGWSVEKEFDESLLLWHIATDICYNCDSEQAEEGSSKSGTPPMDHKEMSKTESVHAEEGNSNSGVTEEGKDHENNADAKTDNNGMLKNETIQADDKSPKSGADEGGNKYEKNFSRADYREMSKNLSDYMLYLLVVQPSMMSSMAGIGLIRYRDTCAEAKVFFPRFKPNNKSEAKQGLMKKARAMLLEVNTEVEPKDVKGDRSKSVLFDAVKLAKELNELPDTRKWKIIGEVWVELLAYAASHCRGSAHAARLSKGGELLMFVWFLMAHLGLGEQFCIEDGHARAKLIVEK